MVRSSVSKLKVGGSIPTQFLSFASSFSFFHSFPPPILVSFYHYSFWFFVVFFPSISSIFFLFCLSFSFCLFFPYIFFSISYFLLTFFFFFFQFLSFSFPSAIFIYIYVYIYIYTYIYIYICPILIQSL